MSDADRFLATLQGAYKRNDHEGIARLLDPLSADSARIRASLNVSGFAVALAVLFPADLPSTGQSTSPTFIIYFTYEGILQRQPAIRRLCSCLAALHPRCRCDSGQRSVSSECL